MSMCGRAMQNDITRFLVIRFLCCKILQKYTFTIHHIKHHLVYS